MSLASFADLAAQGAQQAGRWASSAAADALKEVKGALKNKTELEKMLDEALSSENWGASNTILQKIAASTFSYNENETVMKAIWETLGLPSRSWLRIFKGLTLLDTVTKYGSKRAVDEARDHIYEIRNLTKFRFKVGLQERGNGVREKAKQVVALLSNKTLLKEEREKAKKNRNKYSGIGSDNRYNNGRNSGFSSDKYERNRNKYSDNYRHGAGGGRRTNKSRKKKKSVVSSTDSSSSSDSSSDTETESSSSNNNKNRTSSTDEEEDVFSKKRSEKKKKSKSQIGKLDGNSKIKVKINGVKKNSRKKKQSKNSKEDDVAFGSFVKSDNAVGAEVDDDGFGDLVSGGAPQSSNIDDGFGDLISGGSDVFNNAANSNHGGDFDAFSSGGVFGNSQSTSNSDMFGQMISGNTDRSTGTSNDQPITMPPAFPHNNKPTIFDDVGDSLVNLGSLTVDTPTKKEPPLLKNRWGGGASRTNSSGKNPINNASRVPRPIRTGQLPAMGPSPISSNASANAFSSLGSPRGMMNSTTRMSPNQNFAMMNSGMNMNQNFAMMSGNNSNFGSGQQQFNNNMGFNNMGGGQQMGLNNMGGGQQMGFNNMGGGQQMGFNNMGGGQQQQFNNNMGGMMGRR